MAIQDLVDFIDRQTEDGTMFPRKPWGEGIGIEEQGEELMRSLSLKDWLIVNC